MNTTESMLLACGLAGAMLMLIADFILYLPADRASNSADLYFRTIDPAGTELASSPMAKISSGRLMLGGALGPIASTLYALGFIGVAATGFAAALIVGGAYHALFAHTGFICQIGCNKKLIQRHQAYARYVYKFAALPGLVGGVAFFACVGSDASRLPRSVGCVAPPLSALAKKLVKRIRPGPPFGLAIAGGCTNWWNILFFAACAMFRDRCGE